ncbi:HAMP domain-containing protein [Nakamurella sp. YIM 132087]|uniref:histidine kinase n=1 Tax=Nakamurella alba TaxID=2665158 RepID=A0A7K1FFL1_9ACTN|nr:HAMP domain-containing sensor histidine kinase [Nakamurella alba]MTD12856.1 HAMP domain-containing protein [Nakamurella alba]
MVPPAPSVAPRRWSIRARLTALIVGLAAIGLLAVDVMLPIYLRSELIADRDRTLARVIDSLPARGIDLTSLGTVAADSSPLRSEIGWTLVSESGYAKVVESPAQDTTANPLVGPTPPVGTATTVGDASRPGVSYRILALRVGDDVGGPVFANQYLVAWSPIDDIAATVRRLVFVELLVTAGLLVLLGTISAYIVRRNLKPLQTMAEAADAIRGGDLERRVDEQDAATEMGRLGSAFNGMLDGIGDLVSERSRNEVRLRQFIADASHELRTPVAAVQGYADLYRAGALVDDSSVGRAMERMGFEARRMGALVEDLLTLVQADGPERSGREPVELTELLAGAVEDARAIDATRSWEFTTPGARVTVAGDRMRLHQLFANLLANVRTHTPAGTTTQVSVLPGPDKVAVTVADNGPGVAEESLPRLFDRFFREDPSRSREKGGTGLGLSIVAAIVRTHGGEVMASRSRAGGLAVTVVLPKAVGTAAVPRSAPPVVEAD